MEINQNNIFLKIWIAPREALRFINDNQHGKYAPLLFTLFAMANGFKEVVKQKGSDEFFFSRHYHFIILQGLFACIAYYIYATLISRTGKQIGGGANVWSILRIMSYAVIPSIISFVILIPVIAIYGINILNSNSDISTKLHGNFLFTAFIILEIVLNIWSIILCVIGLSEVQKFSIGKSILNLISPAIFLIFIGLAIFLIIHIL